MNRFKGTQGQWKVSDVSKQKDWIGVATENRVVAICHNYEEEHQKYDAQLIATAPDLLEALIEIVETNKGSKIISATSIAISRAEQLINKALGL